MAFTRWSEDRPKPVRATAGDVFVALSRDGQMIEALHEIYRKLFEGPRLRVGADLNSQYAPAHFIYVKPGRARAEISEVSAWIRDRFGDPADVPPETTPFGYNSLKYDGWVLLFAMLLHGSDNAIKSNFVGSVAGMSWAGYRSARATPATGSGSGAAPQAQQPRFRAIGVRGSDWEEGGSAGSGAASPPRPPSPSSPPAPEKPGFIEKWFGIKGSTTPQDRDKPATRAAPQPARVIEESEDEDLSEEEVKWELAELRRRSEAEAARRIVLRQIVEEEKRGRGRGQGAAHAEWIAAGWTVGSDGMFHPPSRTPEQIEAEKRMPQFGRWNKPVKRGGAAKVVEEPPGEIEVQRAKMILEEEARAEERRRLAAEAEGKSTVEKLTRPFNPNNPGAM